MKYFHEAATARKLISAGEMTIGEVAHAADVSRPLVVVWARRTLKKGQSLSQIDAMRRNYLERAWNTLIRSGELADGTSDQELLIATVRAGYALPMELAGFALCGDQAARKWVRDAGIDAKATRRAFCLTRWREALAAEKQAAIDKEMERRAWWAATPEQREESGMEIPDGNMIVGGHAIPLREWYKQNKG